MSLEKGDFILVDYTGSVKETGEVFDTTLENVAKEKGLYKAGDVYEPKLIVTGEGWVLKALDESLLALEVGKTASVEITPDKAFGGRDPEKVKLVSLRRLASRGITPRLGMRVEMDGKTAIVRTMGSGRVQLDFNPPLAGKTLVYEVTIRRKLAEKTEKTEALIHRRIPSVDIKKFNLTLSEAWVEIEVPEEAFYIEGLQLAKRGIAMDIQRLLPDIITVKFVETFKKEKAASEEKRE